MAAKGLVVGSLMAPTAITLAGALGGLGIGLVLVFIGAIGLTLGPMFGYHIGRALALYIYRDRFDVKNDNSRGEFARRNFSARYRASGSASLLPCGSWHSQWISRWVFRRERDLLG